MATRDGKEAKYELIQYTGNKPDWQGKTVRHYFNDNSIRDNNGRCIEKPEYLGEYEITRANSREYKARRYELAAQAAADAVAAEMSSTFPAVDFVPAKAWGVLNARLAQQIMDSNIPRGFDTRILGQNMGMLPQDREFEQSEQATSAPDPDVINAIAGLVDKIRLLKES